MFENIKFIIPVCDSTLHIMKLSSYLYDKFYDFDLEIILLGFKKPEFELSSKFRFVSMAKEQVGGSNSWSKYIRSFLESIDDKYVFFLLEDYLPTCSPNIEMMNMITKMMQDSSSSIGRFDITFDSFIANNGTTMLKFPNYDLLEIEKGREYRITTQPSLWNKDYLIEILKHTTSPWSFEIQGSRYSSNLKESVYAIGDHTFMNYPSRWVHKGAISRHYKNKINLLGLDTKTIKEVVELELVNEKDIVWGMWSGGGVPSFEEMGGYSFDPRRMPLHPSSRTRWKEYYSVYGVHE